MAVKRASIHEGDIPLFKQLYEDKSVRVHEIAKRFDRSLGWVTVIARKLRLKPRCGPVDRPWVSSLLVRNPHMNLIEVHRQFGVSHDIVYEVARDSDDPRCRQIPSLEECPAGLHVRAYRNLHKGCWSIQQNMGHGYRVTMHAQRVCILNPRFSVSNAGRDRAIRLGKKVVHAYVKGTTASYLDVSGQRNAQVVTYDHKKGPHFFTDSGVTVTSASQAFLGPDGVMRTME